MAFRVYTSGIRSDAEYDEQMAWREKFQEELVSREYGGVTFFHPPLTQFNTTPAEEKEVALAQLLRTDILVVRLDGAEKCPCTVFEVAMAETINHSGAKHIHIVGLGDPETAHPWIRSALMHAEPTTEALCDYISSVLML